MAVERVVGLLEASPVEAREKRPGALEVLAEILVQPREEERAEPRLGVSSPEPSHLVLAKDVVPAEQLVGAFARDHDLEPGLLNCGGER